MGAIALNGCIETGMILSPSLAIIQEFFLKEERIYHAHSTHHLHSVSQNGRATARNFSISAGKSMRSLLDAPDEYETGISAEKTSCTGYPPHDSTFTALSQESGVKRVGGMKRHEIRNGPCALHLKRRAFREIFPTHDTILIGRLRLTGAERSKDLPDLTFGPAFPKDMEPNR
jgi:hypothetical protein